MQPESGPGGPVPNPLVLVAVIWLVVIAAIILACARWA